MARYELLYIIPATHAENELKPVMDGVSAAISKVGAKVARNDMVGKLKLAYPVDGVRHGFYILVDLDLDSEKLGALDDALRLHSDVIRHAVVVKDQKAKPVFKLTSTEDLDREKARHALAKDSSRRQAATARASDKKVEVNMADLDQKLDKIVEGKIL